MSTLYTMIMKSHHLKHLLDSYHSSTNKLSDTVNYLFSQYRYLIYYHKLPQFLMRSYIREQIDFRLKVMNSTCYDQGACVHCGCTTTNLQMSNRICEGEEYPPLLTQREWHLFKEGKCKIINDNDTEWQMVVTKTDSTLLITHLITNRGKVTHEVNL